MSYQSYQNGKVVEYRFRDTNCSETLTSLPKVLVLYDRPTRTISQRTLPRIEIIDDRLGRSKERGMKSMETGIVSPMKGK